MAFRTVVGQDYKAKNSLDDWIEKQEERSRTGKRVENSLAHNAAQAAVLVHTRGMRRLEFCCPQHVLAAPGACLPCRELRG